MCNNPGGHWHPGMAHPSDMFVYNSSRYTNHLYKIYVRHASLRLIYSTKGPIVVNVGVSIDYPNK